MATKIYRLLFILLFPLIGFSQSGSIEGKVYDTLNVKPVVFASVSLIRKADSILVKSLRTDQQGNFQFSKIKPDSYILLIAHSSFVDFVDDVELKEGENKKDLGQYNLYQRGQMLREIVIKNQAGIKIKGETLEFLADSFKVKQGAMVEDLLKVLPNKSLKRLRKAKKEYCVTDYNPWTNNEIENLQKLSIEFPLTRILTKIKNRSKTSIRAKYYQLGLKPPKRNNWPENYNKFFLKENNNGKNLEDFDFKYSKYEIIWQCTVNMYVRKCPVAGKFVPSRIQYEKYIQCCHKGRHKYGKFSCD